MGKVESDSVDELDGNRKMILWQVVWRKLMEESFSLPLLLSRSLKPFWWRHECYEGAKVRDLMSCHKYDTVFTVQPRLPPCDKMIKGNSQSESIYCHLLINNRQ